MVNFMFVYIGYLGTATYNINPLMQDGKRIPITSPIENNYTYGCEFFTEDSGYGIDNLSKGSGRETNYDENGYPIRE